MSETAASTKISELRVAQSELVSGNTSGKVFVRLSEGAVAFLTDRPKAQEQVSTKLRNALLQEGASNNATMK